MEEAIGEKRQCPTLLRKPELAPVWFKQASPAAFSARLVAIEANRDQRLRAELQTLQEPGGKLQNFKLSKSGRKWSAHCRNNRKVCHTPFADFLPGAAKLSKCCRLCSGRLESIQNERFI